MSNNLDDQWYARAAALFPHITGGEAEQLNMYAKAHDGETFAVLVNRLERKYLSDEDVEAREGLTDEELDEVLSKRIKAATQALNEGVY